MKFYRAIHFGKYAYTIVVTIDGKKYGVMVDLSEFFNENLH